DLLPDDRRQVAVEGEHELLELRTLGVVHAEHVGAVEAEERVDAAVVQEAEAADLPAEARGVAIPEEGHLRHAEHADLLVGVAQVGVLLIGPPRPRSPSKATMKRLKSASSSNALPPGLFAPERSPRQCMGPWFAMPRRLCVVIGPLRGLNVEPPPTRNGLLFASGTSSGLPRSQARLSK